MVIVPPPTFVRNNTSFGFKNGHFDLKRQIKALFLGRRRIIER